MTEHQLSDEASRAEMFREFHANHLTRQTKALESIRNTVVAWFVIMLVGSVLFIIAAVAEANSGL